ncbi:hypothetical protein [Salipiger sp. PrR002]|uniref:hypothetical protein n=1 Tax=Salipiger sp. PrR002 TaxID=2706489 RepID=UPI0013BD51D9|nr:hypothetical protein [Salipiger sp. PrR002]NDV99654.1 hypothetical protein [Salipiger sp. PrR002]NDW56748.1 hypothetical protein [Salipiger sp. PrR004]
MSRKFIAAILAGSLVVTGFSAASARAADAKDVAKVLGTAAVVYMIGKAVSEARADAREKDRKKRDKEQAQFHAADPTPYLPRPYQFEPQRPQVRGVLPGTCAREVRGARGEVMLRSCLRSAAVRTEALPDRCKSDVRVGNDRERAFSVQCLETSGWRVAGARSVRDHDRNRDWNRDWKRDWRHDGQHGGRRD